MPIQLFFILLISMITSNLWAKEPLAGCKAPRKEDPALRISLACTIRDHDITKNLNQFFSEIRRHLDMAALAQDAEEILALSEKTKPTFDDRYTLDRLKAQKTISTFENYRQAIEKIPGAQILDAPPGLASRMGKSVFDFKILFKGKIYHLWIDGTRATLGYVDSEDEDKAANAAFEKLKEKGHGENNIHLITFQKFAEIQIPHGHCSYKLKKNDFYLEHDPLDPYFHSNSYGATFYGLEYKSSEEYLNGERKRSQNQDPALKEKIKSCTQVQPIHFSSRSASEKNRTPVPSSNTRKEATSAK